MILSFKDRFDFKNKPT